MSNLTALSDLKEMVMRGGIGSFKKLQGRINLDLHQQTLELIAPRFSAYQLERLQEEIHNNDFSGSFRIEVKDGMVCIIFFSY